MMIAAVQRIFVPVAIYTIYKVMMLLIPLVRLSFEAAAHSPVEQMHLFAIAAKLYLLRFGSWLPHFVGILYSSNSQKHFDTLVLFL